MSDVLFLVSFSSTKIGEISDVAKCLESFVSQALGFFMNKYAAELRDHNMPRYIRITDFDDFNNLNDQTFKSLPIEIAQSALLKDGDLLFARSGASVGKTYLYKQLPNGACYAGYLIKARFNKHVVNPQYVYYFTKSQQYENWKNATYIQATIQNISAEKYYQLPIYLPSIKAQDRMVAYLDTKLSEIDHQVSLLTSKRDAYLRLKKSIINRAVTKGLNPDVQMKDSGIEWIGEVPEGWEACRFKDFITLKTNSSFSDAKIGLENIEGKNGRFVKTDTEFEGNGIAFKKDDIVYGKLRPYLQKVWIAEFEGNAVGDFYVFSVKGNAVPTYIKYLFLSDGFTYEVNSSTVGAKMPRVSSNFILTMCYCLPTKTEQHSISTYLDDKCSKIDRIISNLDKQISKYGELKRSLIDEVITGKRDCIAIR